LYVSDNRGGTWTRLLKDDYMRDVAVDPQNPLNLYAASSSAIDAGHYNGASRGILVSRDGGATWRSANEGLSWSFAWCVEVDPSDPTYVFAGMQGSGFQTRRFTDIAPRGEVNHGAGQWRTVYANTFEDPALDGWVITGAWRADDSALMRKAVTSPNYYEEAKLDMKYGDFVLDVDAAVSEASVYYHWTGDTGRYELYLNGNQVILQSKPNGAAEKNIAGYTYGTAAYPRGFFDGETLRHIKITVVGNTSVITVDGADIIKYTETDAARLILASEGKFAFKSKNAGYFDNMYVKTPDGDLNAEPLFFSGGRQIPLPSRLGATTVKFYYANVGGALAEPIWAGCGVYDKNGRLKRFETLCGADGQAVALGDVFVTDALTIEPEEGGYVKLFTWRGTENPVPVMPAKTYLFW
jgi:hypothetical protein